ncbi:MAG: phytanoyl-CoA dioxygenase family protein [Alphaproteobacteria bacterium]|nr:phytanoyl-CoA dioxygenase family protein [Alphaproteobacteria bacterium]
MQDPAIDSEAYRRDGYLVVPGLLSPGECAALRDEALALCRGRLGALRGLVDPAPGESDEAVMRRYMVAIMPHKIPSLFARMVGDPRIVRVLAALIGPNVKAVHSQCFYKAPGMPGNGWHQDELFIPTRDRSLVTAWIALEDTTVANGCLRVLPGSHRPSVLWPMRRHNNPEVDRAEEAFGYPQDPARAVPLELPAGSAVFFDGYLLHGSYPNRTADRTRRALLYVYADAATPVMFDPTTYQPTAQDYRDIVMVSGADPYAWKGTARLGEPYLRAAGPSVKDLELARLHDAEREGAPPRVSPT